MNTIPQRSVEANELVSTDAPRLRVQIDTSMRYTGNLRDTVSNDVTIDNYYFVDQNDAGQIQRVVYFQFEAMPSVSDTTFNYPDMQTIDIGDRAFLYDGGVRPFRRAKIEEQPVKSDVRKTVDFLQQQGLQFVEGKFYCTLRFVYHFDSTYHKDLLVIYLEQVQEADVPQDVIMKSRYSDEWQPYCDQLVSRALRTFLICED